MNIKRELILLLSLIATINVSAQKVKVVTIGGDKYAAISSEGMAKGFEDRTTATGFLYSGILYGYTETGNNAEEVVPRTTVYRVTKHNQTGSSDGIYNPNQRVSALFAIATTDINENGGITDETVDGKTITMYMDWAKAAGLLATANNVAYTVESSATEKGCYMYQGKSGNDSRGTWRLPTQRELMLIRILRNPIVKTAEITEIVDFFDRGTEAESRYWTATEGSNNIGWRVNFSASGVAGKSPKTNTLRVRCVRDITP